jgi:hypothetical protein
MSVAPVFVVGSARSGTTLLYHMLLSAGNFAVYRAETHAYDVLGPRFNHFRTAKARQEFVAFWLTTRQFVLANINPVEFRDRALSQCACTGDVLGLFMSMVAEASGVPRWSECTPAHLTYMRQIKREIPDALFLHIIRDGRDVALSAAKHGWVRPIPGDNSSPVVLAGLSWRWSVQEGRRQGRELGRDYQEVRFEQLVANPQATLAEIGAFIGQPLDYDEIQAAGIGSVAKPNTSFGGTAAEFNPVGRYRTSAQGGEVARVEGLAGDLLRELGYPVAADNHENRRITIRRELYDRYFTALQRLRSRTPLGRMTDLHTLDIW